MTSLTLHSFTGSDPSPRMASSEASSAPSPTFRPKSASSSFTFRRSRGVLQTRRRPDVRPTSISTYRPSHLSLRALYAADHLRLLVGLTNCVIVRLMLPPFPSCGVADLLAEPPSPSRIADLAPSQQPSAECGRTLRSSATPSSASSSSSKTCKTATSPTTTRSMACYPRCTRMWRQSVSARVLDDGRWSS